MARSTVSSDVEEWFRNETEVVRQKGDTNIQPRSCAQLPFLQALSAGASTKIFEGDFNLLDFSPTKDPAWRQGTTLPDTSRMLQDLEQWTEQYRASSVAPAVLPAFQKHLAGRFIFFNNKAEVLKAGLCHAFCTNV